MDYDEKNSRTETRSKRIHVPRITLTMETIELMRISADEKGVSQSRVYEEACQLYLAFQDNFPVVNQLKQFVNSL